MEKALWGEKVILAHDYAAKGQKENENIIRKASHEEQLRCPDEWCPEPIVKYRHGEKRAPYFAHKKACDCGYARYDRENNTDDGVRCVKHAIYTALRKNGYDVAIEKRVSTRNYADILVKTTDSHCVIIELGSSQTSVKKTESTRNLANGLGYSLTWVIIDDEQRMVEENETYHLKRHCLNEAKYKDVLQIDRKAERVSQYICDEEEYFFEGEWSSEEYPGFFSREGRVDDLAVEEGALTLRGFYEEYKVWLSNKRRAFSNFVTAITEERKRREEEAEREMWECWLREHSVPTENDLLIKANDAYKTAREKVLLIIKEEDERRRAEAERELELKRKQEEEKELQERLRKERLAEYERKRKEEAERRRKEEERRRAEEVARAAEEKERLRLEELQRERLSIIKERLKSGETSVVDDEGREWVLCRICKEAKPIEKMTKTKSGVCIVCACNPFNK